MHSRSYLSISCTGAHPSGNKCFKPGGGIVCVFSKIYVPGASLSLAIFTRSGCNGDPNDQAGNLGCAQPVATFIYTNEDGDTEKVDPRMLMVIHEAFGQ